MPTHPGKNTPQPTPGGTSTRGRGLTSPDELPEEFMQFSDEAKRAAMDAFNGAIADGLPASDAFAMAQQAAQSVDQGQQRGVSDELVPNQGRPGQGQPAAAGRGPGPAMGRAPAGPDIASALR